MDNGDQLRCQMLNIFRQIQLQIAIWEEAQDSSISTLAKLQSIASRVEIVLSNQNAQGIHHKRSLPDVIGSLNTWGKLNDFPGLPARVLGVQVHTCEFLIATIRSSL